VRRAAAAVALVGAASLLACRGQATGQQQPVEVTLPDSGGEGGADAGDAGGGDGGGPPADAALDGALAHAQVDRAGHPLVTVLLVPGSLQDDYNAQPSFSPTLPRTLQDALGSRLAAMDTLALGDGGPDPVDWPVPDGGTHPLLPVFTTDVLLVDTALSCAAADGGFAASYLDLEREVYLAGTAHATCGGRTPNEDVVSETLTLLVTGGRAPVTQGVSGPAAPATTTFPYLSPPN
jgi:hypothetical protein